MEIELLFRCPAKMTAAPALARHIDTAGIKSVLPELTLLNDRDGSEAWDDWHRAAGLPNRSMRNDLVIPDPNVRVQAVVDGQGVALNDRLVAAELAAGQLVQISSVEMADYGYFLAYRKGALSNPALKDFRDWILSEASLDYSVEPGP